MSRLLVLAFDVGTSSVRTALYDSGARRLRASTAQRAYRLTTAVPGMAELQAPALLRAARDCIAHTLAWRRTQPRWRHVPVAAVGMSCFWHSLLGVDAKGQPLTPIYTWADARCQASAAQLRLDLDPTAVHRRTGCMLHSSFWPAKLHWLRRQDRSLYARVAHWLSPGEWLYWQMVGIRACAHAMATGTGLYDPTAQDWDPGMLSLCQISPDRLQLLCDGPLAAAAMVKDLEDLRGAAWCPAIGDGAASNLGSGADSRGTLAINLGSSAAVREVRGGHKAQAPLGLFAYRIDARRHLVGGAISNAGNLREWCRRELLVGDDAAVERRLARRPGPGHGLTVLPFWTAERAPTWRDDMQACIAGMTSRTSALDVLQACVEAGHHRLAQILEVMDAHPGTRLIVSGGGSRGAAGQRRLANVLGRPISVCSEIEASARGAAVRALELVGQPPPRPRLSAPVRPDPELAATFAEARQAQARLEQRLYPPADER